MIKSDERRADKKAGWGGWASVPGCRARDQSFTSTLHASNKVTLSYSSRSVRVWATTTKITGRFEGVLAWSS